MCWCIKYITVNGQCAISVEWPFQFGGRLVSWNKESLSVEISQVVTEPDLVERSSQLEAALSQPQFGPYCQAKAEAATQPSDQVST